MKKTIIYNDFNQVNITMDEIKELDSRIKSCVVENPDEDDNGFYVKIWFNYKMHGQEIKPDGRQEFYNTDRSDLFSEIKSFLREQKSGWVIL